jgi:hypothetical protein
MDKRGRGKPLKYGTAEELNTLIDQYFDTCHDAEGKMIRPYTVTGLAVYLDMTRQMLLEYEGRPDYQDAIKKAKQRIQQFAEEQLFTNRNTAGVIFNMVNNFGWQNRSENNNNNHHTGHVTQTINHDLRKLSAEELAQLEQIIGKTANPANAANAG